MIEKYSVDRLLSQPIKLIPIIFKQSLSFFGYLHLWLKVKLKFPYISLSRSFLSLNVVYFFLLFNLPVLFCVLTLIYLSD